MASLGKFSFHFLHTILEADIKVYHNKYGVFCAERFITKHYNRCLYMYIYFQEILVSLFVVYINQRTPAIFGTYHVLYILCLYDDIGKLNTYDENMNYCFKRRQEVWVLEIVILLSNWWFQHFISSLLMRRLSTLIIRKAAL